MQMRRRAGTEWFLSESKRVSGKASCKRWHYRELWKVRQVELEGKGTPGRPMGAWCGTGQGTGLRMWQHPVRLELTGREAGEVCWAKPQPRRPGRREGTQTEGQALQGCPTVSQSGGARHAGCFQQARLPLMLLAIHTDCVLQRPHRIVKAKLLTASQSHVTCISNVRISII